MQDTQFERLKPERQRCTPPHYSAHVAGAGASAPLPHLRSVGKQTLQLVHWLPIRHARGDLYGVLSVYRHDA